MSLEGDESEVDDYFFDDLFPSFPLPKLLTRRKKNGWKIIRAIFRSLWALRSRRTSSFKVASSTGKSEIISGVSMKGGDKLIDFLGLTRSKIQPTIKWDEKNIDRHLLTLDEGLWNIDEQMDSTDGKAHAFTKMEPPTKQEPDPFVKTEKRVKEETCDFPKREKVESSVKAEPLVTPKIEKSERFGKIETTKPYDFSNAKTVKLFGFPLIGSTFRDEKREILLLQLSRTRDFIRLLLSYPMRTVHDDMLKAWIREASNRSHSLDDLNGLVSQKPLKCFQGLLPMDVLKDVERGCSPEHADSSGIPEDILSLAANLAVDQLIQTLLFEDDHVRNIHHVLFSTRDAAEKRLVKEKIESVLKDQKIMLRLHEIFTQVLLIDASNYQGLAAESHVQHQVAQKLHLPVIEDNGHLLITSIEKEMSRKKHLVLLVDGEAKEPLDPRKVGIPEELAGVVVCITTETSKQANSELTMAMGLNISTKDHLLPWEVFCANIHLAILQSEYTKTMAALIVKECGGHLLAGVIVAKSLRNTKHEDWEHALYKLHSLHSSYDNDMFQGQSSVLLKAFINFIWHDLSKTQKYCLTSCLFIPKFGKLEKELINDWISSRLVVASEAEHTLRDLVDRFALLQLEDTKSWYIQIPQDTYAVLQLLNTQNPLFMKKSELGLVEAPNSELWHRAIYIDLADNKLPELPSSPDCHELKVLKLHNNDELTKIPPLFFLKMPLLCILDLSYTSVRELPNSFFELEQLRELYMKSCECFMKLSSEVGKLKNLEKIDLDKTHITHLPKEIQKLTNLKSLTLCLFEYRSRKSKDYMSSTIIPSGVISKLKGLKRLSIDVNPDDKRWEENLQVILPEVSVLECLQTISLYIPAPKLLNLIPPRIFELDFRFVVGKHMSRIISGSLPIAEEKFKQSERSLKFVKGADVAYEVSFAVIHSKALFLDRHMTIKDLSKFGMKSIEQLQVCILAECKEMQTIVDGRCLGSKDILPRLLMLSVSYMKNLRSICEGEVHSSHSFGMLKTLVFHNCPMLTTVFTLDFLGNLSLLKVLIVKDCPKVSALVSCGPSTPREGTFLPKLRTMTLVHLPELVSISNGVHMGPCLENIGIYNCPKLERLSKMELSSQNLKVIKGDIKWWEALTWSEAEWGILGQPVIFDSIFSPIDKQVDIMSQLKLDDDIDDSPDKKEGFLGEASGLVYDGATISGSSMVGEVLRIKEILQNNKEESDSKLYELLRRLKQMEVTVDLLKATEIGKVVNFFCEHGSMKIRRVARTLIRGWKKMADGWVDATATNTARGMVDGPLRSSNDKKLSPKRRIMKVSRASGGKDRHSKVMTSKSLRDRRVRLSVSTAIQFYDLQDRLGYHRPSKAVEWLIKSASDAISRLPPLNNTFPDPSKQPSDVKRGTEQGFDDTDDSEVNGDGGDYNQTQSQNLSLSESACSSTSETSKSFGLSLSRFEIRVKARERAAKENTTTHNPHNNVNNPISQTASFTELLTGGVTSTVNPSTTSPGDGHEPDLFNKAALKYKAFQSSKLRIMTDRKQIANRSSRRIIKVSRASRGKDRHSKVMTSKGLRDRRVRLSVTTAIQFYDLQDRLGYDRPSKTVEWLIKTASDAISGLPSLNDTFADTPKQPSDVKRGTEQGFDDTDDSEVNGDGGDYNQTQSQNLYLPRSACSSSRETSKGYGLSLSRSEIRVKARERARERTSQKKQIKNTITHNPHNNVNNPISQTASFSELLTGGVTKTVNPSTASPGGDDHVPDLFNKAALKYKAFQPSMLRIMTDREQIANRSSRRSYTSTQASQATSPVLLYNINQRGNSESNADLESFSSMGGWIEPSANET